MCSWSHPVACDPCGRHSSDARCGGLALSGSGGRLSSHLSRLVLHRFRNVTPDTDLHFHPGINVCLGKNGSGKTTLLRVLEAVLSGNFELLWREEAKIIAEFDVAWQERPIRPHEGSDHTGHTTIHYESSPAGHTSGEPKRNERLDIEIVRSDGRKAAYRYADGQVSVEEDGSRVQAQVGLLEGHFWGLLQTAGPRVRMWMERWFGAVLPFSTVWRFTEDLSDFDALMSSEIPVEADAGSLSYSRSRHGVALELPPLLKQPLPRQVTLPRGPIHEAAERMGFRAAEVSLRAEDTGARPVVYSDLSIELQRKDGSWVREKLLSWGQKRLLSWWALRPERYLIADEPTNGMHHEWIGTMIEGMRGRQCFLATQNPLLLDHLEFGDAKELQRRIVRCSVAEGVERERLQWRNPTPEEARRFFDAYTAGFQHVSEILRNEDLW